MKLTRLLCVAAGLLLLVWGNALAFHDEGVAECAGCHTMHNSQDGMQVANTATGNAYLLKYGNASDTCLDCHAAYGQFDGGTGYGPGGDFYWLTKTWTWEGHHGPEESLGDTHGHNIISPANGLTQDGTLGTAPGGDFDSQYLGCTSCHDPHGNMNFRLLYGTEMGPVYNGGRYDFDEPAPLAAGNSRRTHVGDGGEETDARHTVYKSGMAEWCANCHTDFHSDNTTNFVHPIGELGSTIASVYNAYVSSDQQTGGDPLFSYWGLVPFEAVNVDLETVDTTNYTEGPTGVDQVMCVTCHRAHATPFSDIGRWDFGQTFIIESHPFDLTEGATQEDLDNMYYDYTFVTNQRSLCNKCHRKDLGDGPF